MVESIVGTCRIWQIILLADTVQRVVESLCNLEVTEYELGSYCNTHVCVLKLVLLSCRTLGKDCHRVVV